MRRQRASLLVLSLFALIAFVGLACAQSGRIVSDEEATAIALPTATAVVDLTSVAEFQIGDEISVVGGVSGSLVPLYASPGARFFSSQIFHGDEVVVTNLGIDEDGGLWYEVDGLAGTGWTTSEHLVPLGEIDAE